MPTKHWVSARWYKDPVVKMTPSLRLQWSHWSRSTGTTAPAMFGGVIRCCRRRDEHLGGDVGTDPEGDAVDAPIDGEAAGALVSREYPLRRRTCQAMRRLPDPRRIREDNGRHRLDRGGNRQANAVLYHAIIVSMR